MFNRQGIIKFKGNRNILEEVHLAKGRLQWTERTIQEVFQCNSDFKKTIYRYSYKMAMNCDKSIKQPFCTHAFWTVENQQIQVEMS